MGLVTIKAPIGSELTISGNVPDHKMSSGQLDNGADLSASPSTITVDEDKEINFGFSKDETEQPIYPEQPADPVKPDHSKSGGRWWDNDGTNKK